LFPKNADLRQKWRVAVRRIDPVTKKLWKPGPADRVCSDHFRASDFKTTLTGYHQVTCRRLWAPGLESGPLQMLLEAVKKCSVFQLKLNYLGAQKFSQLNTSI